MGAPLMSCLRPACRPWPDRGWARRGGRAERARHRM